MHESTRVAVIGAGPAGLAAADCLARHGCAVELFEAGAHVGGVARSIELWGRSIDLGPHIFAGGDRRALALWAEMIGADGVRLPLRRGIVTRATVLEYPVQPLDVVRKLGVSRTASAAAGLLQVRLRNSRHGARNAEEWIVARYGQVLYDELIRSYMEKLWGVPGTEIDVAFARALFGVTSSDDSPPVPSDVSRADHDFVYPRGGASAVWGRLADRIRTRAPVRLNAPVEAVVVRDGQVAGLRVGGEMRPFSHVISAMPISRLVHALPNVPLDVREAAARLRVRHAVIVHLLVHDAPRLPYLWLYVYDHRLLVGRVSDSRNWNTADSESPDAIFTMEYWCGDADDVWLGDDTQVISIAEADLRAMDVFKPARPVEGHVTRLRGALPVPNIDYSDHLGEIHRYLNSIAGLTTVGRHGKFALSSMADVMADGLNAAEAIVGGVEQSTS